MGLLPFAVVFAVAVSMTTSLTLRASEPLWGRALDALHPATRIRWVAALIATPIVAGLAAVGLAVGPCLETLALGAVDQCQTHGGPAFYACLVHASKAGPVVWAVAALVAAPVGWRMARLAGGMIKSGKVLRGLQLAGSIEAVSPLPVWSVPGSLSFLAGWPRAAVYLGRSLRSRLSAPTLQAMMEHELAHLRRRDIQLGIGLRLLASAHFDSPAKRLLEELELAAEQLCDAEAARAVGDPLLVAQALIDVARLQSAPMVAAGSAFTGASLERRIEALCTPPAAPTRTASLALPVCAACVLLSALLLDRHIHEFFESTMQCLAR